MRTSRTTPPPSAVIMPSDTTPTTSSRAARTAVSAPFSPNANVPARSSASSSGGWVLIARTCRGAGAARTSQPHAAAAGLLLAVAGALQLQVLVVGPELVGEAGEVLLLSGVQLGDHGLRVRRPGGRCAGRGPRRHGAEQAGQAEAEQREQAREHQDCDHTTPSFRGRVPHDSCVSNKTVERYRDRPPDGSPTCGAPGTMTRWSLMWTRVRASWRGPSGTTWCCPGLSPRLT